MICGDGLSADDVAAIEARLGRGDIDLEWEEALAASEFLLDPAHARDEHSLERVLRLLNHAAAAPSASAAAVAWNRARAYMSLQLLSDVPPAEALDSTLAALELTRDLGNQEFRIILGMSAANFFVLLKDEQLERPYRDAVHKAASLSHEALARMSDVRAELAGRLLCQVKLRILERRAAPLSELVRIHSEANALVAAALRAPEAVSNPLICGSCHEVAGLIAAADPRGVPSGALEQAMHHLREAYRIYREHDGTDDVRRCVHKLLELRSSLGSLATVDRAECLEQDLLALEWSYTGETSGELCFAPGLFEAAQEWLAAAHETGTGRAEAAFDRAEALSRTLACVATDPALRVNARFLLGNAIGRAFLTSSTLGRVQDKHVQGARCRLIEAQQAFREALELLDGMDVGPMGARIRAQYAKAISAQLVCCGDSDCLTPAKEMWRSAILHADAPDSAHYRLNLASLILGHAQHAAAADVAEAAELLARVSKESVGAEIPLLLWHLDRRLDSLTAQATGSGAQFDYERAIRLARDPVERRRYLAAAATNLPDYDEARARFLSSPAQAVATELRALRHEPGHERARLPELELSAERVRLMTEELLEQDRRINAGRAGKELLASYLADGKPFLLMLRSFNLESKFVDPPGEQPGAAAPRNGRGDGERFLAVSGDRVLSRLLDRLSADCPCLLVMNVLDPLPPRAPAKLFARPSDWRRLVFALAAEARGALVFVNAAEPLTAGLSDELRALADLGKTDASIVIMEPSLRSLFEAPADRIAQVEQTRFDDLSHYGFGAVFTQDAVEVEFDSVAEQICIFVRDRFAS